MPEEHPAGAAPPDPASNTTASEPHATTSPKETGSWAQGLVIGFVWATLTAVLHLISKSAWWLCAVGAAGVVLVIWPGPKPGMR